MVDPKFTLRAVQPSDSPALTKLITEFEGEITTRFQVDPYQAICFGTEFRTIGVGVECQGVDGFVGMGTLRFGKAQFNGEVLPFAFLDGLKVLPEFRGQGLGYEIARWRVQQARAEYGDACVIGTGMLYDNYASHAVAAKWCREFVESAFNVLLLPMRTSPPNALAGVRVREIEPREYEEFAARQNAFYRNYNLYPPSDADSIAHALQVSVEGRNPYRYFVATDSQGNLLAGAQTWARGVLKTDTINQLPTPVRLMNNILHLIPPDLTIRDVAVNGLWHEPRQLKTARFLWESIRWACRDQGNTLTAGFDARDPLQQVVTLRPWNQPRPKITLAVHGPASMDRNQLLYVVGRV